MSMKSLRIFGKIIKTKKLYMNKKVFVIFADYFKSTPAHAIKRICSIVKTTEDYDNGGFKNIDIENTFETKDEADAQVKILEKYA